MQATESIAARTLRTDRWWGEILPTLFLLGGFIVYSTWAAIVNRDFFADPYISPFYSPCFAQHCGKGAAFKLVGPWYTITPALWILWAPLGFRSTCYYYRKAYYRAFFGSPPACAVRDIPKKYTGEARFPFILQNIHRYFFWIVIPVLGFLWYDVFKAFRFGDEWGLGLGTLVLLINAAALTAYSMSCHSCRYIVGGHVDVFSQAPLRHRLWQLANRLNERHAQIAWFSLVWVAWSDLYVRLVANNVISHGADRLF